MRSVILACTILSATLAPVAAEVVCNDHGAVVTTDGGTVLYLGKDCDAARKGGGTGYYYYSASFIAVSIDGQMYRVHEDVDCIPYCTRPE